MWDVEERLRQCLRACQLRYPPADSLWFCSCSAAGYEAGRLHPSEWRSTGSHVTREGILSLSLWSWQCGTPGLHSSGSTLTRRPTNILCSMHAPGWDTKQKCMARQYPSWNTCYNECSINLPNFLPLLQGRSTWSGHAMIAPYFSETSYKHTWLSVHLYPVFHETVDIDSCRPDHPKYWCYKPEDLRVFQNNTNLH